MPTGVTGLFPVNWSLFDETMTWCVRCGLDENRLRAEGKAGCSNCYVVFRGLLHPLVRSGVHRLAGRDDLSVQTDRLLARDRVLSVRYRLGRNLRNGIFIPGSHVHRQTIRENLQKICGSPLENEKHVYFDEDQLRAEWYIHDSAEMGRVLERERDFMSPEFAWHSGFVNACPTNCIRGNKISVLLEIENTAGFIRELPGYIRVAAYEKPFLEKKNQKILLLVKNCKNGIIARFFSDINRVLDKFC